MSLARRLGSLVDFDHCSKLGLFSRTPSLQKFYPYPNPRKVYMPQLTSKLPHAYGKFQQTIFFPARISGLTQIQCVSSLPLGLSSNVVKASLGKACTVTGTE